MSFSICQGVWFTKVNNAYECYANRVHAIEWDDVDGFHGLVATTTVTYKKVVF